YLLGSIPSALIVGKTFYKIDIREHGSGNMGATNAFRVLGTKAGIVVTAADILKGTIATLIPLLASLFIEIEVSRLIIGIFAVLGHTYPIFAKFKGGKAVATSGGSILGVHPFLFLAVILTFLISLYLSKYVSLVSIVTGVVATFITLFIILCLHSFLFLAVILTFLISLYLSKYFSLASMVTCVVATIITMFMNQLLLFLMILALTIFVFIRHKDNIKRIKNKTEPKITWM